MIIFCCICQESINKEIVRELTCNHIFHIDCIEHWYEKIMAINDIKYE